MTSQHKEDIDFFQRYGTHVGVGLAVTVVLGILLLQMSVTGLQLDDATADTRAHGPPPVPETEVEMVENKVIEQQEVNLDAALDLSAQSESLANVHKE